jgi:hypothetical protein
MLHPILQFKKKHQPFIIRVRPFNGSIVTIFLDIIGGTTLNASNKREVCEKV